jgi:hypothetical protein
MSKKYTALKIRVTPEQREGFLKFTDKIGETPSRLLRKLIRESINGDIDLLPDELLLLRILNRQLYGISNNLNQINKAMNNNTVPRTINENVITEFLEDLSQFQKEVRLLIIKTNRRWLKDSSPKSLLK